jgi:PhnB protein
MTAKRRASSRRPVPRKPKPKKKEAVRSGTTRVDSGLAPQMHALNTYLAVANVNASIEFLERAFGFSRGVVLQGTDGQPRYAEMRHGDSVVMLIPKGDATAATGGAPALYTYVGDVDKALTKARDAGAGVSEAEDRPWGDRVATVTDPDGYRWVLATFKKLVPFT